MQGLVLADSPLRVQEGEHTNNYVEVEGSSKDPAVAKARERILSEESTLTGEERRKIEQHFGIA